MPTLSPYLMSPDARGQAQFYIDALGGEVVFLRTYGDLPDTPEHLKDRVLHLDCFIGGIRFQMTDITEGPVERSDRVKLNLEFPDVEAARQALERLADGGTVIEPFGLQFWGG